MKRKEEEEVAREGVKYSRDGGVYVKQEGEREGVNYSNRNQGGYLVQPKLESPTTNPGDDVDVGGL